MFIIFDTKYIDDFVQNNNMNQNGNKSDIIAWFKSQNEIETHINRFIEMYHTFVLNGLKCVHQKLY